MNFTFERLPEFLISCYDKSVLRWEEKALHVIIFLNDSVLRVKFRSFVFMIFVQ